MHAVLVLDPEPTVRDSICRQLLARGVIAKAASSAEDGIAVMKREGTPNLGLITNVALPGAMSGWDIARVVRDYNPNAAIGYLSTAGQRDWAILGVPDSIVIGINAGTYAVPDAFFSACQQDVTKRGVETELPPNGRSLATWSAANAARSMPISSTPPT